MLILALCAFFAGFSDVDLDNALSPFSLSHPLGTDIYGRDLLERLALGTLISTCLAFCITAISAVLGVCLGFLMSKSGILSFISTSFSNVLKSLSSVIVALFLSAIFGPGFMILIISISLSHIPNIARTASSRIAVIRNEEFVLYARSEGMGNAEIYIRHILPHIRGEILAQSLSVFSSSILTESALSFLGAGIPVLYPSLGSIMADGRALLLSYPRFILIPSAIIMAVSLLIHLMSRSLELDP